MPKTHQTPGIADSWKTLHSRKCKNCGIPFKPLRPEQRFCSTKCRSDFHHHGGSYVKLAEKLRRMLRDVVRPLEERIAAIEAAIAKKRK